MIIEILLWSLAGLLALFYFGYYGLMIYEAKKPSNIRRQRIFPKVSLVIPAYNEEKMILRKLINIQNLNYPKDKLEVLIVDDGSTDNTCQTAQDFINRTETDPDRNTGELKFRLISLPQWSGKISALNFAWQHCSGELVIISDADTTFEESAITRIVQNFADPTVGAVTGNLLMVNINQSLVTRMEKSYRSIFDILRMGESNMDSTPIFNGPISAFRRELLDKLPPHTLADDTELSIRIREKGWKAKYDPEAVAFAYTPAKLRMRIKQKSRRGHGIVQSLIRHRKILFNPNYGKYGFLILPCEFFMHAISPVLVMAIIILSLLSIAFRPAIVMPFILTTGILLAAIWLISLISKKVMLRSKVINPIDVLTTFLDHQISLTIGLSHLLMRRTSNKWEKIED